MNISYETLSCSTSPPPSAHNKVCRQFFRWAKKKDPDFNEHDFKKVYSIYFWDPKDGTARYTTCYSTMGSTQGWCGTCYPGELEPGQEGYCDKYEEGQELDNQVEAARPTKDSRWGWCNKWCEKGTVKVNRERTRSAHACMFCSVGEFFYILQVGISQIGSSNACARDRTKCPRTCRVHSLWPIAQCQQLHRDLHRSQDRLPLHTAVYTKSHQG